MKPVLVLTTEAVGLMVTGEVAAPVVVEVVDSGEEDSEDIKLSSHHVFLKVTLGLT